MDEGHRAELTAPVGGASGACSRDGRRAVELCVPVTQAFRAKQGELLGMVTALTFKQPGPEWFAGKKHFLESSLNLGSREFVGQARRAGLADALESGKYQSFACDLGPNCITQRGYSPNGFPRALPTSPPISAAEYVDRAVANVRWLSSIFGGCIQAENLNYFPTGAYETVCEPEFISEVIRAAGVELLLDVAHAFISAHYLRYRNPMEYISRLPLDMVRGVHLSHAGVLNGVLEDLHEVPTEQDLQLVGEVRAAGAPVEFLTVEYYRDAEALCNTYHFLDRWRIGLAGRSA